MTFSFHIVLVLLSSRLFVSVAFTMNVECIWHWFDRIYTCLAVQKEKKTSIYFLFVFCFVAFNAFQTIWDISIQTHSHGDGVRIEHFDWCTCDKQISGLKTNGFKATNGTCVSRAQAGARKTEWAKKDVTEKHCKMNGWNQRECIMIHHLHFARINYAHTL